jgi:hypothetical protein
MKTVMSRWVQQKAVNFLIILAIVKKDSAPWDDGMIELDMLRRSAISLGSVIVLLALNFLVCALNKAISPLSCSCHIVINNNNVFDLVHSGPSH